MKFAPKAFRETRTKTTKDVERALVATVNMTDIRPAVLIDHPEVLPALRMATCPPVAVDRLIGLAGVSPNLVKTMEQKAAIPPRMPDRALKQDLEKIGSVIRKMADPEIFVWLERDKPATGAELHRAATIVADRLCGAVSNPIIRNAQEQRQLAQIRTWLEARGYRELAGGGETKFDAMPQGTFSFRMNVPVKLEDGRKAVNISVDAAIKPLNAPPDKLPVFLEAKSAGDAANTNKRRKEEAVKMAQLRSNYGDSVRFGLFLCGYFNSGYLGYEAAEGIDWVWEHRISDLAEFGI